jgi:uncharacterized protein (TIGR00255 family)
MRSMTGYARAGCETEAYTAEVELRTVNHRFLDMQLRLPATLVPLESRIRDCVNAHLSRGKVEVVLRLRPRGESALELQVDRPLLAEMVKELGQLARELELSGELSAADLLRFPQAFTLKEREVSDGEEVWRALHPALEKALVDLDAMRRAEGERLAGDLERRLAAVGEHLEAIEALADSSRERRRSELEAKVSELLAGASLDPQGVAMEVARLVDKADVSEEISRLRSHLALWRATVTDQDACGKKLDFIVQEMNREANTIGSKCQDSAMAARVIAIKTELERVREQVQNVE